MTCDELKEYMDKGIKVVDVRTLTEHNQAHISGSVHMNVETLEEVLEPNEQVLLYCRSGARSGAVANYLNGRGFQAVNIGGIAQFMGCLEY